MFKLFAELIAIHIDSTDRLASSEANLANERPTAELREQFVAVLGHDLRNPLASIQGGTELLMRRSLDDRSKDIVRMMRNSAARMSELINNVLDLTQARMGGGFHLYRVTETDLTPVLDQVVSELRLASPDCAIEMECKLEEPINCDRARIAQLFFQSAWQCVSAWRGNGAYPRFGRDGRGRFQAVRRQFWRAHPPI